MDMHELWDKTCEKLKAELNRASYQTWIETNLTPKALEGNVLTLIIALENMKVMITNRYAPLIATCLSQVAGQPMSVEILTKAEYENKEEGRHRHGRGHRAAQPQVHLRHLRGGQRQPLRPCGGAGGG